MLTRNAIRRWYLVHKWSSLVCTVFLLLLCLTGLPLIFHHEIEDLGGARRPEPMAPGAQQVAADRMTDAAKALQPGKVIQYIYWEPDEPNQLGVALAADATTQENVHIAMFDAGTGKLLSAERIDEGFMYVMFKLHVDLFAGLAGKLFLGVMGLLLLASIVSGTVLYAPFMRKLVFGTVRRGRSKRTHWLDLHNLLGIAALCWLLVVGFTGVINTWADLVLKLWQFDQLSEMVAPYRGKPPLAAQELGPVQAAVDTARAAIPGMEPAFVAYPGTLFSSQHHYAVFMRGTEPLTKRLLQPALVDARTAQITETRKLPWYVTTLLLSQPLHFGDYGGLPLKILWALLDAAAIVVLGSGLYLWLARRRKPLEQRIDEVMEAGEEEGSLQAQVQQPVVTAREGA